MIEKIAAYTVYKTKIFLKKIIPSIEAKHPITLLSKDDLLNHLKDDGAFIDFFFERNIPFYLENPFFYDCIVLLSKQVKNSSLFYSINKSQIFDFETKIKLYIENQEIFSYPFKNNDLESVAVALVHNNHDAILSFIDNQQAIIQIMKKLNDRTWNHYNKNENNYSFLNYIKNDFKSDFSFFNELKLIDKECMYFFNNDVLSIDKLKLSYEQSIEIHNNHSDKEFILNHYSPEKPSFSVPPKSIIYDPNELKEIQWIELVNYNLLTDKDIFLLAAKTNQDLHYFNLNNFDIETIREAISLSKNNEWFLFDQRVQQEQELLYTIFQKNEHSLFDIFNPKRNILNSDEVKNKDVFYEIQNDKEIALKHLKKDIYDFKFVGESLKNDKIFVKQSYFYSYNDFIIYPHLGEKLKKDTELVNQILEKNSNNYKTLDIELRHNKEFVFNLLKNNTITWEQLLTGNNNDIEFQISLSKDPLMKDLLKKNTNYFNIQHKELTSNIYFQLELLKYFESLYNKEKLKKTFVLSGKTEEVFFKFDFDSVKIEHYLHFEKEQEYKDKALLDKLKNVPLSTKNEKLFKRKLWND